MTDGIEPEAENVVVFALGLLFGLAKDAYSYYFGSTARSDDKPTEAKIVNGGNDPVPVEDR